MAEDAGIVSRLNTAPVAFEVCIAVCHTHDMEKVNAVQLRQSLGAVLKRLARTGRPILLEKDRRPAAVIISLEDYRKRFVDVEADRLRRETVDRIKQANLRVPKGMSSLDLLREVRGE